jgi:hypothetical protein
MSDKPKVSPEAFDVVIPKNVYKFRVIEAENERSKKNNSRMAKLTLEFIETDPINHNDKNVDINGLTIMSWSVVTAKSLKFANITRAAFGLSELKEDEIDLFDAKEFLGKTCFAIAHSTLEPQLNDITKEPLKNPYTGEALTKVQREISEWIPKPKGEEN